jgi:hypothetical protein
MERFGLNQYLRYGLSGTVFLLTLIFIHLQTAYCFSLSIYSKFTQASIVAGLILLLLIGISIYTIHRSIIYPLIYRYLLIKVHGFKRNSLSFCPFKFSPGEIELDVKRLKRRCEENNPYTVGLNEWFSRIHFLYCSGWAIIIGLILGYVIKFCAGLSKTALLILILGCLWALAYLDDKHVMKVEKEVLNNHNNWQ